MQDIVEWDIAGIENLSAEEYKAAIYEHARLGGSPVNRVAQASRKIEPMTAEG